jgi:hypothetical protein
MPAEAVRTKSVLCLEKRIKEILLTALGWEKKGRLKGCAAKNARRNSPSGEEL